MLVLKFVVEFTIIILDDQHPRIGQSIISYGEDISEKEYCGELQDESGRGVDELVVLGCHFKAVLVIMVKVKCVWLEENHICMGQ